MFLDRNSHGRLTALLCLSAHVDVLVDRPVIIGIRGGNVDCSSLIEKTILRYCTKPFRKSLKKALYVFYGSRCSFVLYYLSFKSTIKPTNDGIISFADLPGTQRTAILRENCRKRSQLFQVMCI